MPLRETEAIVLRTYRLGEADKIISLFTRQFGRLRAAATGAQRPKSRYGGTLEPLSYVRLWLFERENRDLLRLNSAELVESFFDMQKDYRAQVAAQYLAEVSERLLPEREVNERAFRLLVAVSEVDGDWPVSCGYFTTDRLSHEQTKASRDIEELQLAAGDRVVCRVAARSTGKYVNYDLMRDCLDASGCEATTDMPDDLTTLVSLGSAPPIPPIPEAWHGKPVATVVAHSAACDLARSSCGVPFTTPTMRPHRLPGDATFLGLFFCTTLTTPDWK